MREPDEFILEHSYCILLVINPINYGTQVQTIL